MAHDATLGEGGALGGVAGLGEDVLLGVSPSRGFRHFDSVHDDLLGVVDAGVLELGADIIGRPEAGHAHQGPALGFGGGGRTVGAELDHREGGFLAVDEREGLDGERAGGLRDLGGRSAGEELRHRGGRVQEPGDAFDFGRPGFGAVLGERRLHGGPDGVLLVGGADAEGGDGVLVGDVEATGELDQDRHGLVGRRGVERGSDVATDGDIRVGGELGGDAEGVMTGAAQRLEGQATQRRIGILEERLGAADAFFSEVRQEPDAAGGDIRIGVTEDLRDDRQGLGAETLERIEAEVTDVDGRVTQHGGGAFGRGDVDLRDDGLEALRSDAVDRAGAGVVKGLVAADAGVVPVRDVDGAVGTDGDVGRAEEDALVGLGGRVRLELMEVGAFELAGRVGSDEVLARGFVEGVGTLLRSQLVSEDRVTGRLAVQERAGPGGAERAVLVDRDAGGRAAAVDVADVHGIRIVLTPVGARHRLAGTLDGAVARAGRSGVAGGTVFEDEGSAAALGVVVIALEEVAERGREAFEAVAVAVAENLETGAVGVETAGEAGGPDEAVVALRADVGAGVEGPLAAALVDVTTGDAEGLARLVGHDRAAVAGVDVKLAVRTSDHGVERVVMILAAEAREESLLLVDGGVEFAVAIHVGVLRDGRGVRDVDDVVDHGDAERRGPIGILDERLDGIGEALALGVAEHDHAVTLGATLAALVIGTVVDAFIDPESALGVEIDVGRVGQHGRTSPERDLETFGQLEDAGRERAAFGRLIGLGRRLGGRGGLGGGHEGRGGQEEKRGTG